MKKRRHKQVKAKMSHEDAASELLDNIDILSTLPPDSTILKYLTNSSTSASWMSSKSLAVSACTTFVPSWSSHLEKPHALTADDMPEQCVYDSWVGGGGGDG